MQDKIANPTNFDQYLLAIFAEDEYSIKDDLRLTFGARYNHHEIFWKQCFAKSLCGL